jgi:hypothetical protein
MGSDFYVTNILHCCFAEIQYNFVPSPDLGHMAYAQNNDSVSRFSFSK